MEFPTFLTNYIENTFWKLNHGSREIFNHIAGLRSSWDDSAEKEIRERYLTPCEEGSEKALSFLSKQTNSLEQYREKLMEAQFLLANIIEHSEILDKKLETFPINIKEFYRLSDEFTLLSEKATDHCDRSLYFLSLLREESEKEFL